MKKILLFVATLLLCTSCYDDYVQDYGVTKVYFYKQHNTRTVVVGENMDIEFGVVLTGVLSNDINRNVGYCINTSLESDAIDGFINNTVSYVKAPFVEAEDGTPAVVDAISVMPSEWYTVSNETKIVIPRGDHLGTITFSFDEDKLTTGATDTRYPFYVVPLEITSADDSIDEIYASKDYTLVAIVYEAMLFGNYYHSGETVVTDASTHEELETLTYTATEDQPEDQIWTLSTLSPNVMECNKLSDGSVEGGVKLTLNENNTIKIETAEDSAVTVSGTGTFNDATLLHEREITLEYSYEVDGKLYTATDKLEFRNRVRDGVNEWRDENEENYN